MEREMLLSCILDSMPYPLMFVDKDFVIRYLNREARFRYEEVRGFGRLDGKSVFEGFVPEKDREKLIKITNTFQKNGPEVFDGVTDRNERKYYVPVRDKRGNYLGYYERFELNVEKQ